MKKSDFEKPITASELMTRLRKDPAFVAREKEVEDRKQQRIREYRLAMAPLLEELAKRGFSGMSVSALYNQKLNYKSIVPVLIDWLPKIADPYKEGIVRALSVKWTPPEVALLLIKEFYQTENESLRWAIGNAIEVIADDRSFDEIVKIAKDPKFGKARQMFVRALAKWKTPAVVELLKSLLSDQKEVAIPAIDVLGKFGGQSSKEILKPLLDHPDLQIQRATKKVLEKL